MAVPTSDTASAPPGTAIFAGRPAPVLTMTPPSPTSGTVGVSATGGILRASGAPAPVPFVLTSSLSASISPASGTLPPDTDVPYSVTPSVEGVHTVSMTNGWGLANPAPVALTVTAAVAPQESPFKSAVDTIDAAPMNSWVKLNENSYDEAWSPAETRPSGPTAILGCWASVGVVRGTLVAFGGGHANSFSNETYTFSLATRRWKNAFVCTDYVQIDVNPAYRSADGNGSPLSSHCYHNNNGLPILNRFYTGGGAVVGNGGPQRLFSGDTPLRRLGGFTLDLTLAGQGMVAGVTGSNYYSGSGTKPNTPGANAWKYRDWCDGRETALALNAERIESGTAYAEENGRDVLYFTASGAMYRAEFFDDNQINDVVTRITGYENGLYGNGAMALDVARQVIFLPSMLDTATKIGHFVDLKRPVDLNRAWGKITSMVGQDQAGFMGPSGDDISKALSRVSGLTHDPRLGCFVIWTIGRQPFLIYPPEGNPTPATGWTVVKPTMDTVTACPRNDFANGDTGTNGKFRYVPEIGCSVAVVGITAGDVWALKLAGWTRPTGT